MDINRIENSTVNVNELAVPVEGYYYWHCPNCRKAINPGEEVCKCGQHIRWGYPLSEEERMGFEVGDTVFPIYTKSMGLYSLFVRI